MTFKDIIDHIGIVLELPVKNVNLFFVFDGPDGKIVKQVLMTVAACRQVEELVDNSLSDYRTKLEPYQDEDVPLLTTANSISKGFFVYDFPDELPLFTFVKEAYSNHPLDYWSKEKGKTFEFEDAPFTNIDAIIFSYGTRDSHITYYRKNYALNTFAAKLNLKYFCPSNETLDIAPDKVLRIDGKIDVLLCNDKYIVSNLSMIQKDAKFKELIQKDSALLLQTLKDWDIIIDFDKIEESAKDLAVAMKLSSIKHDSPILETIKKEKIIEFIKKRPKLIKIFDLNDDKISVKTKKAQNCLMHILADDYVRSLLVENKFYVSSIKKPVMIVNRK